MRRIPLTQGFYALVDDEDFNLVSQHKWYASVHPNGRIYADRTEYISIVKKKSIRMHRLIMGFPKSDVDHRNRNGLDNRRKNLRAATRGLNNANSVIRKDNTSGAKGVSWHPVQGWQAYVYQDGKKISLGYFENKRDAVNARKLSAEQVYQEFARLK